MKKNWKTTLMGFVGAIAIAIIPILQTSVVDWNAIAIASAIAVLGVLAKDFNVTGK